MTDTQLEAPTGATMWGPVDYVVIEFADAKFTGEGLPILLDLVAKGVIRILDAEVIKVNDDGTFVRLSAQDLDATGGVWEMMASWGSELLTQDDVDMVGAMLAPGSAAAVIVYENTWAGPFAAAMIRAGGEVIAFDRIQVADFLAVLDAAPTPAIED
jgi:hypothetical protein